jgi:hypothetical protein
MECGGLPPLSRRQLAAGRARPTTDPQNGPCGRDKPRPTKRRKGAALQKSDAEIHTRGCFEMANNGFFVT